MHVEATTANPPETDADTVAVGVFDGEDIAHELPGRELGELLRSGEASREHRRLAVTHAGGRRFVLVGLGARDAFDPERARAAAATVEARARELGAKTLCWEVPHHVGTEIPRALVEGTLLRGYAFDRYKPRPDSRRIERLLISAHHDVSDVVRWAAMTAAAQNRARDLGNTPANELSPTALAEYAETMAERFETVAATVIDGDGIRYEGMGAFAAVAQGSAQDARLIRLDYASPEASAGPLIGLLGKAVTFDSGGLSLKPKASMHEMKFDMAGGAAVIETIAALAELEVPARVMAIVGATENMPSATATRPGDIVRALDGTTIEIDNTDAEGRLVLADCISYARREGAERLVDVATLTGAIVVALGSVYAGLFANDEPWAELIQAAALEAGEPVWRMPLAPEYARMVEGRYAQITNRPERREANSITAAEFLHHFAGEVPWAHLDVAGTAYDVKRPYLVGKGATGYGVRLMVELVRAASAAQIRSSAG